MVRIVAQGAGIKGNDLKVWLKALMESDPNQVGNEIEADLLALIGDSWIFDPTLVPQKSRGQAVGE